MIILIFIFNIKGRSKIKKPKPKPKPAPQELKEKVEDFINLFKYSILFVYNLKIFTIL